MGDAAGERVPFYSHGGAGGFGKRGTAFRSILAGGRVGKRSERRFPFAFYPVWTRAGGFWDGSGRRTRRPDASRVPDVRAVAAPYAKTRYMSCSLG